jgi:sugar-specific transcriptional regulator TrmB
MLRNQDVEALGALGLTSSQAKVYLTLIKLGEAKIRTISTNVQIARQDIYRVIEELEKRCLVEKVLSTPISFKALPINEAVPLMLQRVKQKAANTENQAMKLTERYLKRRKKVKTQEKETKFSLISERVTLSRRLKKAIDDTQRSIDLICSRKTCMEALFDLAGSLRNALERSVKIRWIIDKPLDYNSKPAILDVLLKYPLFKIKWTPHNSIQTFSIYDREQVFVASNPKLHYLHSSSLWTNATPIVELAQNHFNMLWDKT